MRILQIRHVYRNLLIGIRGSSRKWRAVVMISTILLFYLGLYIGVPVWYYIVCGILFVIQGIKLGMKIGKRRVRLEEIKTTPSQEKRQ